MGIAPYKTFTFDGVSSDTYGVYITGEGVFNAPERDVEMIDIHGRNGAYAFDNGRFMNIKVKYKIGMYDVNESNFATKMSNFRNWLCSKVGYVRLSDEYNPNEYRMAVYSGGLEVSHEFLIAGEAEITFECKPQRWLTSGETATAVANNGTLSNPTLFDASPLLSIKGYGDVNFNGYTISIESVTLGNIRLAEAQNNTGEITFDGSLVNNNDPITVQSIKNAIIQQTLTGMPNFVYVSSTSVTKTNADCDGYNVSAYQAPYMDIQSIFEVSGISFTTGTAGSVVVSATIYVQTGTAETHTHNLRVSYDGAHTISLEKSIDGGAYDIWVIGNFSETIANSTVSALGNPTWIDCDIGECWMVKNSEIVSLNGVINLGSDLPKLTPGTNTFTMDNTITELKVTPRWWIV